MPDIIAFLILSIILIIFAAPIVAPVIVAVYAKTLPISIRAILIFSGFLTGVYTYIKYREALNIDWIYRGFRVLNIIPVQYAFSAYSITTLVSFVILCRSLVLKKPWKETCISGLSFATCAAVGIVLNQVFWTLPFHAGKQL